MSVRTYRELVVWQKAMDFVADVYRVTMGFPKEELYGITSQVRRAAVSVPSNIANSLDKRADRCWRQKRKFSYLNVLDF